MVAQWEIGFTNRPSAKRTKGTKQKTPGETSLAKGTFDQRSFAGVCSVLQAQCTVLPAG